MEILHQQLLKSHQKSIVQVCQILIKSNKKMIENIQLKMKNKYKYPIQNF